MTKSKILAAGSIFSITLLIFICLPTFFLFGQHKGTFADKRDGQTYNWEMFGKQAWMLCNLNYKTPAGSWVYGNDSLKEAAYGRLYDWSNAQKACPKGWHLPDDGDWNALIVVLGGEGAAGLKFQQADTIPAGMRVIKAGDPENLFSLLAGVRHADGSFTGIGLWGGCWSATSPDINTANNYLFTRHGASTGKSSSDKSSAFSVRCVRNK
jgi:uncharacterized protein (TIGR02145 family)